jgi:hypothetical protein
MTKVRQLEISDVYLHYLKAHKCLICGKNVEKLIIQHLLSEHKNHPIAKKLEELIP